MNDLRWTQPILCESVAEFLRYRAAVLAGDTPARPGFDLSNMLLAALNMTPIPPGWSRKTAWSLVWPVGQHVGEDIAALCASQEITLVVVEDDPHRPDTAYLRFEPVDAPVLEHADGDVVNVAVPLDVFCSPDRAGSLLDQAIEIGRASHDGEPRLTVLLWHVDQVSHQPAPAALVDAAAARGVRLFADGNAYHHRSHANLHLEFE